jgi:citrate synthase
MAKTPRITPDVERRDDQFSQKIKTRIWSDTPSPGNAYVSEKNLVHGYNLLDISSRLTFTESIYLNLKGELPNKAHCELFDNILSALSNLGPRHAAVRAVMNAAVSKTRSQNLLPIGMTVLSGEFLGAAEVENSVRFIRKHLNRPAFEVAESLLENYSSTEDDNSVIVAGFGARFGSTDPICQQLAQQLLELEACDKGLRWANDFCTALQPHGLGWLITGLAAACFVDLGFKPKASAGIFQLACAPGMLAHGLEMSNQPLTAMPFVDDARYSYTEQDND